MLRGFLCVMRLFRQFLDAVYPERVAQRHLAKAEHTLERAVAWTCPPSDGDLQRRMEQPRRIVLRQAEDAARRIRQGVG